MAFEVQYTLKEPRSMGYNPDYMMSRAQLLSSDGNCDIGVVVCKAAYGEQQRE